VADVWLEIEDVEREMVEFTLLDRTYVQLPPRAQTLLLRASVLDEEPPLEALQWMLGDEDDAMPALDAELKALLDWGMLARQERGRDEVVYPMHALVRDYARRELAGSDEDGTALLLRAARFWELRVEQTRDLWDHLRARDYYYRAGEYEKAGNIVEAATEPMVHWGLLEWLIRLLNESIKTQEGMSKAVATMNLATVYEMVGDPRAALRYYAEAEQTIAPLAAEDKQAKRNLAAIYHQVGIVHQGQGNLVEAQAKYEQSLAAFTELGAKREMASSLGQLGMIHQERGNLVEAQAKYEQSLVTFAELGAKREMASSMHRLGMIHQEQENLGEAQAKYEQSLAIRVELGDKSGIAMSLHNLGIIHQEQGNLGEARVKYEQSLAVFDELGAKHEMASSLHQFGRIHQKQGNLGEAQAKYEQSLAIRMELGDKSGIASSLNQLGRIHQLQGNYREALKKYAQALMLFEQLGSPDAESARHNIALLRDEMGEEAFAAALAELGAEIGGEPETEEMTLEQMVDMVVQNTLAVLTDAPGQREEWWGMLGQLRAQAQGYGEAGFVAFLDAVQQVVEGAEPAGVRVALEGVFAEGWRRLVEGGGRTSDEEIHDGA
jgi:tetratricopeptide (TPR) repeat protein